MSAMQRVRIEHNGKSIEVWALRANGGVWIHRDGESDWYELRTAESSRSAQKKAALQPEVVLAPMPGKVTKVMKKPGDVIEQGDTAVVMEAMKMEYTLKAAMTGKVAEIRCEPGAQVGLGDLLMRIEAP